MLSKLMLNKNSKSYVKILFIGYPNGYICVFLAK